MFFRFYLVVIALFLALGASAAPVTSSPSTSLGVVAVTSSSLSGAQATGQITQQSAAPYVAKFEYVSASSGCVQVC